MSYLTAHQIQGEITVSKRMLNEFIQLETLHGRNTVLGDYYYVLRNRQEKYHDKLKSDLLTAEIRREWFRLRLNKY